MNVENVALTEKGFIEKSISIKKTGTDEYTITAHAKPTGKKKEEEISMTFNQNGLNALVGGWAFNTDLREKL